MINSFSCSKQPLLQLSFFWLEDLRMIHTLNDWWNLSESIHPLFSRSCISLFLHLSSFSASLPLFQCASIFLIFLFYPLFFSNAQCSVWFRWWLTDCVHCAMSSNYLHAFQELHAVMLFHIELSVFSFIFLPRTPKVCLCSASTFFLYI